MPVLPGAPASGQGLTSAVFPLALPVLPGFSEIKVGFRDVIGVSRSPFTSSRQVFEQPGDYLFASLALPAMVAANARAWCAWLALLRGQSGSFLLGDTSQLQPRGSVSGTPVVDGASQSGKTLATRGWTALAVQVLRSGDWLQIGSGLTQRLYMNLLDVNADAAGKAVLNLYPRLRESPADGAVLVTSGPQGCFALAANDRQYDVDSATIYGIAFDAVEAI